MCRLLHLNQARLFLGASWPSLKKVETVQISCRMCRMLWVQFLAHPVLDNTWLKVKGQHTTHNRWYSQDSVGGWEDLSSRQGVVSSNLCRTGGSHFSLPVSSPSCAIRSNKGREHQRILPVIKMGRRLWVGILPDCIKKLNITQINVVVCHQLSSVRRRACPIKIWYPLFGPDPSCLMKTFVLHYCKTL